MKSLIFNYEIHSRVEDRKILLAWALGCLLFIALMWGLVIAKIHFDRVELLDKVSMQVGSQAKNYAKQVAQTLTQIDQFSMVIKYQWEKNRQA